ncbi:hypothetical protein GCM10007416_34060 [Kroppenstedtia guangzhouensis]|uniref:Uncharacterized protein n=1 Tax=Kroppenstedtia guangzhouensis TaxID=1274356 RepID=A0ABQ1H593_9BACL|nr:hypothetical protein [Kroppenstedtia guangzhouensis]GGA58047.1 hypothetical protein GCM10007416_34060 [Kroppenstedtia guangzhouensis]
MDKMALVQLLIAATGDGPVTRFWEEVKFEIQVLYTMFVGIGALVIAFWMRKYILLLGFIGIAMLVGVLVYDAEFVADGGVEAAKYLFGGWMD